MRIAVPDAEKHIANYLESRESNTGKAFWPLLIDGLCTPLMSLSSVFQLHGHRSAYDRQTLCAFLEHVGFSKIHCVLYREGQMRELLIDSEMRRVESIYVEAIKEKYPPL